MVKHIVFYWDMRLSIVFLRKSLNLEQINKLFSQVVFISV